MRWQNSFKGASGTVQNGQITLPTIKDGKFDTSGQASFNVNELFPGTSTSNNQGSSYYFPDANNPNVDNLKDV